MDVRSGITRTLKSFQVQLPEKFDFSRQKLAKMEL